MLAIVPLTWAGFHRMAGHVLHPVLDVLGKALLSFELLLRKFYVPVVLSSKLTGLVANRMKKRREKVSGGQ